MTDLQTQTIAAFYVAADTEAARPMVAYMRDQFPYLGIPTPKRKALQKDLLKAAKKEASPDWDFINHCWSLSEREFQYLAIDYLIKIEKTFTADDISALKNLAVQKSWWDTIDGLDRIIGRITASFPTVKQIMLDWSLDDNFWLRRIAIDHQLTLKEQTDTVLLSRIIENNLGSTEFFINKAIGWSLRDYSKINPDWVREFVEAHKSQMAALSIKEASKYL